MCIFIRLCGVTQTPEIGGEDLVPIYIDLPGAAFVCEKNDNVWRSIDFLQ
jgi:hypothetical protein